MANNRKQHSTARTKSAGRKNAELKHLQRPAPAGSPMSLPLPLPIFVGGIAALFVAIAASGTLAAEHFFHITPPGCGEGSGCDDAVNSVWGEIPLIGWPISLLGLAYFVALLVVWLMARKRGLSMSMQWIVRFGGAASILLTIVMLANSYLCKYCLATHVGNIAFLIITELAARRTTPIAAAEAGRGQVRAALVVFAVLTLFFAPFEMQQRAAQKRKAAEQADRSTEQIISAPRENRRVFTGRYHYGPTRAPIRVVMFTDYQCVDCNRIEDELRAQLEIRDDIQLSIKHFPFDASCNQSLTGTMHANACSAARAAEAAGIIGGNDLFWKMHFWLFDQNGGFTDAELEQGLQQLGIEDTQHFKDVMQSQQALQLVQQDVAEAMTLGLHFTPLIYINGIEFTGWQQAGNLTNAIERVAAMNPEPLAPNEADDTPPGALEKYVNDWRDQRLNAQTLRAGKPNWTMGDETPVVDVIVFGDYLVQEFVDVDRDIRTKIASGSDMRYTVRFFPMDQTCNNRLRSSPRPGACLLVKAAEAAGVVGGDDAFWKMHEWLIENGMRINGSQEALVSAAASFGLDRQEFIDAMNAADVTGALQMDTLRASGLGLGVAANLGVPLIIINDRILPRNAIDGGIRLDLIFNQLFEENVSFTR